MQVPDVTCPLMLQTWVPDEYLLQMQPESHPAFGSQLQPPASQQPQPTKQDDWSQVAPELHPLASRRRGLLQWSESQPDSSSMASALCHSLKAAALSSFIATVRFGSFQPLAAESRAR